jgi:SSS family transporter
MLAFFVILYLGITVVMGYWASRKVKNTADFVVAGRSLPLIMVASVMFATWFGSETILGASSEFVQHGLIGVVEDPFGAALCLILIGLFFARPLYRMQILTFSDYFKIRYGKRAELLSALMIVPSYFGWIAAQLLAIGILLNAILGIPTTWGVVLSALLVIFYTWLGGMWAISITDFFQTIAIIVGMIVLAIILVQEAGGLEKLTQAMPKGFLKFTPEPKPLSVFEYLAAWITIGLGSIPQQDVFQRVLSAKNEKVAVRGSLLGGVMYLTVGMLPLLIGFAASVLYPETVTADPQTALPNMILAHTPLAIQILFFGALLSAILSTASAAMLAPAAIIGENIVKFFRPQIPDAALLRVMRLGILGVAAASVLMALSGESIYELVAQSSALSLVSLFIPLSAGLYWKRANSLGALFSMASGLLLWLLLEIQLGYGLKPLLEGPPILWGLAASIAGMAAGSGFKQPSIPAPK